MSHYFTNDNLKSEIKEISTFVNDKKFSFYTDNGVFSKNYLDFGSRSLIGTIISDGLLFGDVLDLGCGIGTIGIILSSFFNINVTYTDVNKRALHLTEMNIKKNGVLSGDVLLSNVYENVNKKYDFIITNPPIRAGKEIVYKMLFDARFHLNDDGLLYFVMNKDQGAKSTIKKLDEIACCDIISKNKGFLIIRVKFN